MIDISYGILHYNPAGDELARNAFLDCVDSLALNKDPRYSCEVTIIDQGNPWIEVEAGLGIAKKYGFNFVSLPKNVGISRGINTIVRSARGKYISLVTSDTIFTHGLDTKLITSLENNHNIWQICPLSDRSSFSEQRCYTDLTFGTSEVPTGLEGTFSRLAQELTIQFWPRITFERVGYFDERWKACYENLDYALRIALSGGDVHIDSSAFCWHIHNMTTKNGSINSAYKDYINMDGIDHTKLDQMWRNKWRLDKDILYGDLQRAKKNITHLIDSRSIIYMPYIQNVGY